MSQKEFYQSIGMSSGSFRGKALYTPLNSNAIVNIITNYPEVTLDWLVMGKGKSPWKSEVDDSGEPVYGLTPKTCEEKDIIIKMLKEQVEDLKRDKEDLRSLLKLERGKE